MDGEQKRLACVIRHLQKFDWDNEKAREVSHTVCPRSIDPFYIIVLNTVFLFYTVCPGSRESIHLLYTKCCPPPSQIGLG